jgi:chromosome condensin MukBEF complex kleisin-like MukF subunit
MQYGYKVDECNHTDCPYRTETITNADRIRAMSDEELAKRDVEIVLDVMEQLGVKNTGNKEYAIKARLERLKQPAEEE